MSLSITGFSIMKIVAQNKKASYDYEFLEKIEAGIVLTGDEVKSIRAGHVNLIGAFGNVHDGELFLINCHMTAYSHAYSKSEEATRRSRKLLVHRKQLNHITTSVSQKGITIIPLKMYLNEKGLVKIELALAKHKKGYMRKEEIRERDIERETRRELRGKF